MTVRMVLSLVASMTMLIFVIMLMNIARARMFVGMFVFVLVCMIMSMRVLMRMFGIIMHMLVLVFMWMSVLMLVFVCPFHFFSFGRYFVIVHKLQGMMKKN